MKHVISLVVLILLSGCSWFKRDNKPERTFVITSEMEERVARYCALSKTAYDERKWVVDRCDGAGFTSLYSLACPSNGVDLSVFQGEGGEMFRDPKHECWISAGHPSNGSKASYSKDHVLMRMIAAYEQKDIKWFESFLAFIDGKSLQFCQADNDVTTASRCILSLGLYQMLNDGLKSLQGQPVDDQDLNLNDDCESDSEGKGECNAIALKIGFEAHLDVQSIRLRGLIYGGITDTELRKLLAYAVREPLNGFYQAVAYRYGQRSEEDVRFALENLSHWPIDKLPSSNNHCDTYVFSRDILKESLPNSDWLPCKEGSHFEEYSGTDYTFSVHALR